MVMIWLTVVGCVQEKLPPLSIYTLQVASVKKVKHSPYTSKVLKVAFPLSLKENLSDKMLFSYANADRGAYVNARWSNPVGKLIQGVLIESLQKSGAFKAVLPERSTATEQLRLESIIYDFSHHIRNAHSYASVSVAFSLIDSYTGDLIKTKRFVYNEPTPTVDAKGYAVASNRIMTRMTNDLIMWLLYGK
jgi:cholesterol transport system auxiliary component